MNGPSLKIPSREQIFRLISSFSVAGKEAQVEMKRNLLTDYPSFTSLLCAQQKDSHMILRKSVPLSVLCAVLRELAHRYGRALLPEGNLMEQPELLRDYLMVHMARERVEQFRLLFLDEKNCLIRDELQSRGTINHVSVYPREVAKRCLELKAERLIMVHNHPAGQTMPSRADVVMTQHIETALKVIDVVLVDHFIITRKAQTSFRQLGLLAEQF